MSARRGFQSGHLGHAATAYANCPEGHFCGARTYNAFMRRRVSLLLTLIVSACQAPTGTPPPPPSVAAIPPTTPPSSIPDAPAPDGDAIRIDVHVRHEWIALPSDRLPKGTQSAVAIPRAYDPETGKGYGELADLGADPLHLVRGFTLDGDRFLVGEPIVLEHVVKLEGPGTWEETLGGNYRARGRDDNYAIVLVAKPSGEVVPDLFGEPGFHMGGLSTRLKITRQSPQSVFVGAQTYSAIAAAGAYDLYAMRFADSHQALGWQQAMAAALKKKVGTRYRLEAEGNELVTSDGRPTDKHVVPTWKGERDQPSPVKLPEAVRAALTESERTSVVDVTHLEITLVDGTPAQRRAMVKKWRGVTENRRNMMQASLADAAFKAIWYARQDDFLPAMEAWLKADVDVPPQELVGLAMRPSRAATTLLLEHGGPLGLMALGRLHRSQIAFAFPLVIERLDDADDQARAYAFDALSRWSGERFGASWNGFQSGRPTADEASNLEPRVRAWWKDHRQGFVPKP